MLTLFGHSVSRNSSKLILVPVRRAFLLAATGATDPPIAVSPPEEANTSATTPVEAALLGPVVGPGGGVASLLIRLLSVDEKRECERGKL